jgi:hypothetical protein
VVDLTTGSRLETNLTGASCPVSIDPSQAIAFDTASTTDYFCSCPNPNNADSASSNVLEIPMIGIIVSFVGAVMTSLGQVLMKWAHTHNELRPLKDRRTYYANPFWFIGLVTYAASQILCVVAFASVTQGENAVIGTFSLAANAVFAQHFLGEAMQRLHFLGIFFIATGSTMVLISTLGVRCINTPEAVQEIKRALSPHSNLPFFCFMMILGTLVFVALSVRRLGECSKHKTMCFRDSGGGGSGRGGRSGGRGRQNNGLTKSLLSQERGPSSLSGGGGGGGGGGTEGTGTGGTGGTGGTTQHPNQYRLNELNSTNSSTSSMFGRTLGEFEQYSDRAMLFVTIAACMGCISSFCASVTVKLVTVELSSFGTSVAPWVVLGIFVISVCMSMHYLNRGKQHWIWLGRRFDRQSQCIGLGFLILCCCFWFFFWCG